MDQRDHVMWVIAIIVCKVIHELKKNTFSVSDRPS